MRRLAFLAVLALLAATPSALGVSRVVGGAAVDVRDAPWSVLVLQRVGPSGALCTGAILDPLRVVTAAHCVVEDGGVAVAPSSLQVLAGVTNAAAPSPTDAPQSRPVASMRVHHGYTGDRAGGDDVAVLTLATALDLNGVTARAISLPGPSLRLKNGDSVTVTGYGLKTRDGTIDGTLNGMTGTLVDSSECLRPEYDRANGVLLCAFSGSSSPCGGDSGGALVLGAPTAPILVGVTRAASCRSNSSASYANVTAPEILQFIQGNDNPPTAPRATGTSLLERPTAEMQVGQSVTCKTGGWSGNPTLSYELWEASTDTVRWSGTSPSYKLRPEDAGFRLYCRVIAANDGGTTFDQSPTSTGAVQNPPELLVPATSVRRGGTAAVRVQLYDWVRPLGKVDVCVRLAPRIGGKTCRLATPAGSAPTVVMEVKVKPTAPAVRARAAVTARAADGRAANQVAFVSVR